MRRPMNVKGRRDGHPRRYAAPAAAVAEPWSPVCFAPPGAITWHRSAKRKRALLESNPPRNSRPETHQRRWGWGRGQRPRRELDSIGVIDFGMPEKLISAPSVRRPVEARCRPPFLADRSVPRTVPAPMRSLRCRLGFTSYGRCHLCCGFHLRGAEARTQSPKLDIEESVHQPGPEFDRRSPGRPGVPVLLQN